MVKFVWVPSSCIATLVVVRFYPFTTTTTLTHQILKISSKEVLKPCGLILRNTGWSQNGWSFQWTLNIYRWRSKKPCHEVKLLSLPKLHSSKTVTRVSTTLKNRWFQYPSPVDLSYTLALWRRYFRNSSCPSWGTYVHFVSIWGCKSLHSHSVGNWPLVSTTWTSQHFAVRKGNCGTCTSRCVCWKFRTINLGSTS